VANKKSAWSKASNTFTFKIPRQLMDVVDYIISVSGRYSSRGDFVREAIRRLVAEELRLLQSTMSMRHSSVTIMQIKVIDAQELAQEEEGEGIDAEVATSRSRA